MTTANFGSVECRRSDPQPPRSPHSHLSVNTNPGTVPLDSEIPSPQKQDIISDFLSSSWSSQSAQPLKPSSPADKVQAAADQLLEAATGATRDVINNNLETDARDAAVKPNISPKKDEVISHFLSQRRPRPRIVHSPMQKFHLPPPL